MNRKEKRIQEEMDKLAAKYQEEIKGSAKVIAENIFKKGMAPQNALAIPPRKIEGIYAQGYQLYNAGNYKKAYETFELLTLLNGQDPRFVFGMAASLQGLGDYQKAFMLFMQSANLDADNPVPYYHAADCCLKSEDKVSAVVMLHLVIEKSKNLSQYSYIKDRAKIMQETLTDELNKKK
jgi:type III secretion system low calcium response chaperone LcrH/SycD